MVIVKRYKVNVKKDTEKRGNFGFFNPLPLLALLCVCGTCHSFFLYAIRKRLSPRFFAGFFGPLPSKPYDFRPVLKNR